MSITLYAISVPNCKIAPIFCKIFICVVGRLCFACLNITLLFRMYPTIVACYGSTGSPAARNAPLFPVTELVEVYRLSEVTVVRYAHQPL